MYTTNTKINNQLSIWLIVMFWIISFMIIVGGLTRLTDSGLSITEWELFTGIMPPMNEIAWNNYFLEYKKIPQFFLLNQNMSLDEFKIIFYWEYFHRIIARFIGLFFLLPLVYFYFSKKINKKDLKICYLILFLIVTQGIVGWYMVKSGLVNDVTVSHYRLSLHLLIALSIISIIFWLIINRVKKTFKKFFVFSQDNIPYLILIFLIFCQIVLGAFVSGLDAGRIYQTWPLMGQSYFPNDFINKNFYNFFDFENHSLVQFYHRNMAYLITLYIIFLTYSLYKKQIKELMKPILLLNLFLILQIVLGVLTLISGLEMYLASAHQITSVLLIFTSINLYYYHIK